MLLNACLNSKKFFAFPVACQYLTLICKIQSEQRSCFKLEEVIQLPPRASYSKGFSPVVALPEPVCVAFTDFSFNHCVPSITHIKQRCCFLSSVNQSCLEIMQKRTILGLSNWNGISKLPQNTHETIRLHVYYTQLQGFFRHVTSVITF